MPTLEQRQADEDYLEEKRKRIRKEQDRRAQERQEDLGRVKTKNKTPADAPKNTQAPESADSFIFKLIIAVLVGTAVTSQIAPHLKTFLHKHNIVGESRYNKPIVVPRSY